MTASAYLHIELSLDVSNVYVCVAQYKVFGHKNAVMRSYIGVASLADELINYVNSLPELIYYAITVWLRF